MSQQSSMNKSNTTSSLNSYQSVEGGSKFGLGVYANRGKNLNPASELSLAKDYNSKVNQWSKPEKVIPVKQNTYDEPTTNNLRENLQRINELYKNNPTLKSSDPITQSTLPLFQQKQHLVKTPFSDIDNFKNINNNPLSQKTNPNSKNNYETFEKDWKPSQKTIQPISSQTKENFEKRELKQSELQQQRRNPILEDNQNQKYGKHTSYGRADNVESKKLLQNEYGQELRYKEDKHMANKCNGYSSQERTFGFTDVNTKDFRKKFQSQNLSRKMHFSAPNDYYQQQNMKNIVYNICPIIGHQEEFLMMVCVDPKCPKRELLCTNCLSTHSHHKIMSLSKFIVEFKSLYDEQSQPITSNKQKEIGQQIMGIRETAQRAQKILDQSYSGLLNSLDQADEMLKGYSQSDIRAILTNIATSETMIADFRELFDMVESFSSSNGKSITLKQAANLDHGEQRYRNSDLQRKQFSSYTNTLVDNHMQYMDKLQHQIENLFIDDTLPTESKETINKFQQLHSNQKFTNVAPIAQVVNKDVIEVISDCEVRPVLQPVTSDQKKAFYANKQGSKQKKKGNIEMEEPIQTTNNESSFVLGKEYESITIGQLLNQEAKQPPPQAPQPPQQSPPKVVQQQVEQQQDDLAETEAELNLIKTEYKNVILQPIMKMAFVDQDRVLVVSQNGKPTQCNHVTQEVEYTIDVTGVCDMIFEKENQLLIVGTRNGYMSLYKKDTKANNEIIYTQNLRIQVDKVALHCIYALEAEKVMYGIGDEKVVKCYSTRSGRDIAKYEGFSDQALALLVISERNLVIVGGTKVITFFDKNTKKLKINMSTEGQKVQKIFNDEESSQLVIVLENRVLIVNADTLAKMQVNDLDVSVSCAGYISQWNMLIMGCNTGQTQNTVSYFLQIQQTQSQIIIYSVSQQQRLETLEHRNVNCIIVQGTKDKKQVVLGDRSGSLILYTMEV